MRLFTRPIVPTAYRPLLLLFLLVLGVFPAAPTAVAAPGRHAPDGVSTALLKVQTGGFSPSNPNVTRIAAGRDARIVFYAFYSGITAPVTVRVSLYARRGNTLVFASGGTFVVGRAQLGGATSGWRWYWNDIGEILKQRGRLSLQGVITTGGVTQVRYTRLIVY